MIEPISQQQKAADSILKHAECAMTSFLRTLAYRYSWIYDSLTAVSSLSVGGVGRLRCLGLEALQHSLCPGAKVLDLCCGSGEAAAPWLSAGFQVTGLDIAPNALDLARQRYPKLHTVEGLAEDPPLPDKVFDAIQLSIALHEFSRPTRKMVLRSCQRLLRSGGWLVIVDLHPASTLMYLPQQLFCALFETDTAIAMLEDDLPGQLRQLGFTLVEQRLLASKALQLITCCQP